MNTKELLDDLYEAGQISASEHCDRTAQLDTLSLQTIDLIDIVYAFTDNKLTNAEHNRLLNLIKMTHKDYLLRQNNTLLRQNTFAQIEAAIASLIQEESH